MKLLAFAAGFFSNMTLAMFGLAFRFNWFLASELNTEFLGVMLIGIAVTNFVVILYLHDRTFPTVDDHVDRSQMIVLSHDKDRPYRIVGPSGEHIADCSSSLTASALLRVYNAYRAGR